MPGFRSSMKTFSFKRLTQGFFITATAAIRISGVLAFLLPSMSVSSGFSYN